MRSKLNDLWAPRLADYLRQFPGGKTARTHAQQWRDLFRIHRLVPPGGPDGRGIGRLYAYVRAEAEREANRARLEAERMRPVFDAGADVADIVWRRRDKTKE